MGKTFGFFKNIVFFIGVILLLNFLVNWLFIWENNGKKYLDKYIQESIELKINAMEIADWFYNGEKISPERYKRLLHEAYKTGNEEMSKGLQTDFGLDHNSYLKYSIFFKGIMGSSKNYTIQDAYTGRYYKIMRFDKYGSPMNTHAQSYELPEEEVYVTVDSLQYNDLKYGTRNNPIVVLKYKGVNKIFSISATNDNDESYLRPIAPTEEEYRYNVENYLTYVMSSKDFKDRFKD